MINLKDLRTLLKPMTQGELAKIVGVTQNTISSWELGKTAPDIQSLILLARHFEVSVDYLVGNIDESETSAGISALNPDDKNLLLLFHSLGESQQKQVLAFMEIMKKTP